ncbi:unnamed protein product [Cunninghamella echinulata]
MDPKEEIRKSKILSYILRHGAQKEKLNIRPDGFIKVSELLARPKLKDITLEQLKYIVEHNDKQRYHLQRIPESTNNNDNNDDCLYIRANQGHTLKSINQIELEMITSALPVAIHGTTLTNWSLIQQSKGLSKMNRNHIHLATGLPNDTSVKSGIRTSSQVYIYIDMEMALKDDITFYKSKNGVILTEGINGILPLKYFKSVVDKQGNKLL